MPLIKCPECENEISDKVDTVCPKCGYKHDKESIDDIIEKSRTQIQWYGVLFLNHIIFSIFFIFILAAIGVKNGELIFGGILVFFPWYIYILKNCYLVKKTKVFFIIWNTLWLLIVSSGILYKI